MRRKLVIVLAALATFGPALSILYIASIRRGRPAVLYPDYRTTWVLVCLVCGYVGLLTALDLVLQVLRPGRRLSHSVWLCGGTAAACVAGFLSLWTVWLTPWRLWLLPVNGLALTGLFYLLYRCHCRFELRLFGLAFTIAGLALFVFALDELHAIADMAAWARVEGRVTEARQWRLSSTNFWRKELAYEYMAGGRQYVGHEDCWKSSRTCGGWGANLDRAGSSYSWNEDVIVYYDPARPDRAVLRPGLSYATAFVLKVSLLSILGGLVLLVAAAEVRPPKATMYRLDRAAAAMTQWLGSARPFEWWAGRTAWGVLAVCGLWVVVGIQPLAPHDMRVARVPKVPVTADEFHRRGSDLLWDHDPRRAINNFTRALHLDPNTGEVYYYRGRAYVEAGQVPQAVADWSRAIQLDWHVTRLVYYDWQRLTPAAPELGELMFQTTLEHLGDLQEVSGSSTQGIGEFYIASLILSSRLRDEDFLRMARDENPIIRAMALICLARRDLTRHRAVIQSFFNDTAEVIYVPAGDINDSISLSALAKGIMEDPNMLRHWAPDETE